MWVQTTSVGGSSAGGINTIINLTDSFETSLGHNAYDETVVAMYGHLSIQNPDAGGVRGRGLGSLGIGYVSNDAIAGANVPDNDEDYDWLYTQSFTAYQTDTAGGAPFGMVAVKASGQDVGLNFQLRNSRKHRENASSLIAQVFMPAFAPSSTTIHFWCRTLYLLP